MNDVDYNGEANILVAGGASFDNGITNNGASGKFIPIVFTYDTPSLTYNWGRYVVTSVS